MWAAKGKNYCRQLRERISRKLADYLSLDRSWIHNHIASCPRCQKRLAHVGKVELAISLLKSQPHGLDLLMRANTQAISVLKHCLRTLPKADKLRNVRPELSIFERCARYKSAIVNVAACIFIAVIMKAGTFQSARRFETSGRKTIEHYYTANAGEDIARDIFSSNA
ncbi:MAG: hypothetical protein JW749_06810 [Sedimentisphaerales bacterium]|nr:hypothetical protein [Sedimentisphaerales bacterium]